MCSSDLQRVQLIKSALSSIPLYFLLSLKLQPGLIKPLDRILRQCLWRDKDGPKPSLAAWEMICKPKVNGGLGIIDFQKKNDALLLKHLDKFYNNADMPWVKLIRDSYYYDVVPHAVTLSGSFWWRGIINLADSSRLITHCKLGTGYSMLFWEDLWQKETLAKTFPRLFSFAKDKQSSVKEFLSLENMYDGFH